MSALLNETGVVLVVLCGERVQSVAQNVSDTTKIRRP